MMSREAPTSSVIPLTFKQRVIYAGGWNAAGFGVSQVVRLGGSLIMTRLLVPEMFGIMAIAGMVGTICALLSDVGVSPNIVQSRHGDEPAFLDTAWVVQIIRGMTVWIACLAVSGAFYLASRNEMFPANSVYASAVLPLVIAVTSFSAVINGFRSTKMATALRNLDQRRLMQVEIIGQCAGLGVMIAVGVITRSIWALVAGGLVGPLMTTMLSHSWLPGHGNRFRVDASALRELLGFGKWIFISSAVYVFANNGDRLLLGGYVNAQFLGLYAIASLIVAAVGGAFNRLFAAVWLPALSAVARSNPSRLRSAYYRLRVPGDLSLLFASGFLFACGPLLVSLLYDPRYAEAGSILRILALSLFAVRYGVAQQVYLALGMSRYVTVISVAQFFSFYALVPLLYRAAGVGGAIWAIALHGLATVPFHFFFGTKLRLNDVRRELLVLLAMPTGGACGLALNLLLASHGGRVFP